MTRKRVVWATAAVISLYALVIVLGVVLRMRFPDNDSQVYGTYKDLIPLAIALPAAYLAYVFQSRSAYLTGLRAVWSRLADAVGTAIAYTELPSPTREAHAETLRKLSTVIEEVRGMYKNVPARGAPDGWYPFEPVKQIYDEMKALGYDERASDERRASTRAAIYDMWKGCRASFLAELNVAVPTYHHTQYASVPRDTRRHA